MHDEALMLCRRRIRGCSWWKSIKDVRSHGIYSAAVYEGLDVRP